MANFSDEKINEIWAKAKIVGTNDPNIYRQDLAGAWIAKNKYGTEDQYGWEIDHIKPLSKGGTDNSTNLQPLHWENNRTKADDYPEFKTSISSEDNKNIKKEQSWKINQ